MPQDKLAALATKPYEGSDLLAKPDKSYNCKCGGVITYNH